MPTKILLVNDATLVNSGYGKYGRELLLRLSQQPDLQVAEYATNLYADVKLNAPWPVYPGAPNRQDKQAMAAYDADPQNIHGQMYFEEACLNWRPDVVMCIRDYWMDEYVHRSPYRHCYKTLQLAPVDAMPQNPAWIDEYRYVDGLLTYNNWSARCLKEYGLDVLGVAPAKAPDCYFPVNKLESRYSLGLPLPTADEKPIIIGTVMRNQPRKLFNDLFASFSKLCKKHNNLYLYCHTGTIDSGSDIVDLLLKHEIANKVYFTYQCKNEKCKAVEARLYQGNPAPCYECQSISTGPCGIHNTVDENVMAVVYNAIDYYVQYANCFTPETKVLTEMGYRNISKVQKGDKVYTHQGRFMPVINTFKRSVDEEIKTIRCWGDYNTIQVTNEHPFVVVDKDEVNNLQTHQINLREKIKYCYDNNIAIPTTRKNAEELNKDDLIVEPISRQVVNVDRVSLEEYFNENTVVSQNGYYSKYCKTKTVKNTFLEIDDNALEFFGIFAANGGIQMTGISVCVNKTTKQGANESIAFMEQRFGRHSIVEYNGRDAFNIAGYDRVLKQWFKDNFYQGDEKKLPDFTLLLDKEKQKNILYGLFISDGHKIKNKNVSVYNSTSEILIEQICFMLRRLGIIYNVRTQDRAKKGRKTLYAIEVSCDIQKKEFGTKKTSTISFCDGENYYRKVKEIGTLKYNGEVHTLEVAEDHTYTTKIGCVQNCEGLGMPAIEAASCGVPVLCVDYSAMSDVVRQVGGVPIKVKAMHYDTISGRESAVPDNDNFIQELEHLMSQDYKMLCNTTYQKCCNAYNWDRTAEEWFRAINKVTGPNRWLNPKKVFPIPSLQQFNGVTTKDFVTWLFVNVLGDPNRVNSYYFHYIVDCLNTQREPINGYGMGGKHREYNREMAYQTFAKLAEKRNYWESRR